MAKNTTLKTRIQNRHDTEANWTTASNATNPFIPLKGEVIVYDPDTTNTSPRVKIGDGVTKVGNLAFVGGNISNFVTTDTEQTISSLKSFSQGINVNGINDKFGNNLITVGSNGILVGSSTGGDNSALILCGKAPKPKYSTDGGTTSVELALISDIPSIPTNYVTTDTAQTISGNKLFLNPIQVGGSSNLEDYTKITSTDITVRAGENASWYKIGNNKFSHGNTTSTYTATLPNKSGTIALTSDVPTLDSATLTGLMTGSNGVTVADKASKVDISFTNSPIFYNQTEEEGYVAINESYMGLGPQLRVCANGGADYALIFPDRYSIYVGDVDASIYGVYDDINGGTSLYIDSGGTSLGRILTTKDLDTAPTKVKDTFVASSWSTSSDITDTQFGKYYKDVTIPNKNIINVRCVSTKGMSGIALDYAPEIKCNNRRTSDTNLRLYSNSQLEGAVTITLVGDTLPNKFSKTNTTLSVSSWTTSSAAVDTQFAKYHTDITVPAGDVMNIRILSNEDITGISTAAYYPEVWSDNRKINSTTLRVYSNKQVAGSVTILTMEV